MKKIKVNGVFHGHYDPETKSFYRDVDPAKHLLRIFGNAPAHRIDGWEVLATTLDIEKYYLNENGRMLEADWRDILEKAFPFRDQMVFPRHLFRERNDINVITETM